jgi:adenylosuccinate synthase
MSIKHEGYWQGVNHITDTQFGDTGKGKLTDMGAEYADVIVKTNGGANAGHTVNNEHGEFKLHLLPSGVFNPDALCIVGSNVVVDPFQFIEEYSDVKNRGVSMANCLLSRDAQMVMPWHKMRDKISEVSLGNGKIGTTGKGIGPAYADRTLRTGLRLGDLLQDNFENNFREIYRNQQGLIDLQLGYGVLFGDNNWLEEDELFERLLEAREVIGPMITNTMEVIGNAYSEGKSILGEAGQGALLDLDFGGYPYVTSSHPGVIGFTLSTGLQARDIHRVIGSTKAYFTRVGEGPMPTELHDEVGQHLQEVGKEVGTTTGRTRRTGWFDSVLTEYGARTSGVTSLALTKLDVLDDLHEIKVCVGYRVGNQEVKRLYDMNNQLLSDAQPIYESLPGWETDTTNIEQFADLPINAQKYIKYIENRVGMPVDIVSVGPDRQQSIYR